MIIIVIVILVLVNEANPQEAGPEDAGRPLSPKDAVARAPSELWVL